MILINLDEVTTEYAKEFITNSVRIQLEKRTTEVYKIIGENVNEIFIKSLSLYVTNKLQKKFDYYYTSSLLVCDDFMLPIITKDKQVQMVYADFIPKEGYGFFTIDTEIQSGTFIRQIIEEHRIHTHNFPKGWFVIIV